MNFMVGDAVMHCTYGLGTVVQIEERSLYGPLLVYFAVQIGDLTIWVPDDENLDTRLRRPSEAAEFQRVLGILAGPGESLPEDRFERKQLLLEWLKDGRAESLCRVIRGLANHRRIKSLNDNDLLLLKRTQNALISEWGYCLSIPATQAEYELHRLLAGDESQREGKL